MSDTDADDEYSFNEIDDISFPNIVTMNNNVNSDVKDHFTKAHISIRTRKIQKAEDNLLKVTSDDKCYDNGKEKSRRARNNWKKAYRTLKKIRDPWDFILQMPIPKERVKRFCYNSLTNEWEESNICLVKMENSSFSHGAMRECFRLKKMASILQNHKSWVVASNYVAKRYIEPVDDQVYFDDVKLQMDAKLWGQEYSRQSGVIKKVDICQMSVIKFIDRVGEPLYHLEHFIEGDYKKYNSNSGFVDEYSRNTPQAFSHFTFERSGHRLIVVDIQGVGDIYTDPQIHTVTKTDYGDGNLGTRGMALFFYSHICNSICKNLGLQEFDLSESEKMSRCNLKRPPIGTVANVSKRARTLSDNMVDWLESYARSKSTKSITSDDSSPIYDQETSDNFQEIDEYGDDEASEQNGIFSRNSDMQEEKDNDKIDKYFNRYSEEKDLNTVDIRNVIIGEIHHEMAKLHGSGRLAANKLNNNNGDNNIESAIDWTAFLFHEEMSAQHDYLNAIINLANYHLALPIDPMFDACSIKMGSEDKGLELMEQAATLGDRPCMIYLGTYYTTQYELCDKSDIDKSEYNRLEAVRWLENAVQSIGRLDKSGCYDSVMESPDYELIGRIASLLQKSGFNSDLRRASELFNDAGEKAMQAGKGKLASKYYELAEEIVIEEE